MGGISNLIQELSQSLYWLPLLCFLQRLSLTWKQGTAFDSWGHIFFVESVRKNKSGPFGAIYPPVVNGGRFYYPLFSHWLYSLFPARLLVRFNHLLNPAIDAIFLFCCMALLRIANMSDVTIAISALLYIFTPLCFSKIAIGPRVANFTTRIISEILLPLLFLVWFLEHGLPTWITFLLCSTLGAVILMSSKFGVQALTFFIILVCFLTADGLLALVYVTALLMTLVLSRGAFLKILKEQINHLTWYFRSVADGKLFVANRNSVKLLWAWAKEDGITKNIQNIVFNWLAQNSLTLVMLKAPAFLGVVVLLNMAVFENGFSILSNLQAVLFAALVIYLATSFKYLLFLGEAERYLTHVAILFCLALPQMLDLTLPHNQWLVAGLILYGLIYWIVELFAFAIVQPFGTKAHEKALVATLKALPDQRTVLSYPYHVLPPYRIMVETDHRTFFPILAAKEQKTGLEPYEDYPYPELTKVEQLYQRFAVDCLVIEKAELAKRLPDWQLDMHAWEAVPFADHPQILVFLRKSPVR